MIKLNKYSQIDSLICKAYKLKLWVLWLVKLTNYPRFGFLFSQAYSTCYPRFGFYVWSKLQIIPRCWLSDRPSLPIILRLGFLTGQPYEALLDLGSLIVQAYKLFPLSRAFWLFKLTNYVQVWLFWIDKRYKVWNLCFVKLTHCTQVWALWLVIPGIAFAPLLNPNLCRIPNLWKCERTCDVSVRYIAKCET